MALSLGVALPRFRTARPLSVQVVASETYEARKAKHMRIRAKVNGTPERPRLCVFRSNNNMYCQVIDDVSGSTLAAACTLTKEVRAELAGESGANQKAAALVGKRIAEVCIERGITKVCFDRAGYVYHGRVQAVAEAAREAGLDF